MKELLLVPLALMMAASPLAAADLPVKAQQPLSSGWSWTGLYIGAHAGAMWGRTNFSDPFGPSIFGDTVRTPGYLFGGQIGYNWQQGSSPWVLGVEADISALDSDGTFTCFAFSGIFISANCRVRPHALGTFSGRVGYAVGSDRRTLLYAKGGAAWTRDAIDITSNNQFNSGDTISTTAEQTKWGWTAGAGVERALTPAWSLKLEYDYAQFGGVNIATPASQTVTSGGAATPVPGNVSSATQNIHLAKIGLNYRWGEDPWAGWGSVASPALPVKAPLHAATWAAGWEIEGGTRYWYNSDRFQWDNAGATGGLVQSRLTYDDRTTHAGELFGRIDSPWGMFVKGFIGGGATVNGHMNDEDWGIDDGPATPSVSYTNTRHAKTDGNIGYATIDIGHSWLRGADYKVGAFVGYNYFREKMGAFGCVQTASPMNPGAPCAPANALHQPFSTAGAPTITERATWQSVRLGVAGEYMLTDRLKVTGEAAYLPYVKFDGEDNHFGSNSGVLVTVFPQSGHGAGVQLEAMLSYALTDRFSIGVGGRYWAMWTTEAQYRSCKADGTEPCSLYGAARATTEQVGVLVQTSYKFNASDLLVAR